MSLPYPVATPSVLPAALRALAAAAMSPYPDPDPDPDPGRIAALRASGLFAPRPSAQLDRLAGIAAAALDAPMAIVALVGDDHVVLPGCAGLPSSIMAARRVQLGSCPCEQGTRDCTLIHVTDFTDGPSVRAWPLSALGVAAQLGAPLTLADGHTLGSLSVLDRQARRWSGRDEALLTDLASVVVAELERNRESIEREVAQLLLRRNERHFRSLIENASDMISLVDRDGTFRYLSPAYERCTGRPAAALLGRSAFDDVHPDDVEGARSAFATAVDNPGTPAQARFRYRHQSGEWSMLAATTTSLLDDPAVRGVVINSRDITDRVRLEAQLRHAQKMEAVGRLAGGVAHDFNNLLTVIEAHSEFALEAIAGGGAGARDDGALGEDLEAIRHATTRATSLTSQLLAFSRKQILKPRLLDLNEMLPGLAAMLRRLIGEDVALVTDLADAPCVVHADPGQLEQVVMNLAVNARDAMPEGGTVRIATALTTVTLADASIRPGLQAGRYVLLTVADTGSGIDPFVLPHVFEPFYTTKAAGRGTGLGLATVYGVVKQSGGYVDVESTPGRGSTFTMLLPLHQAAAEPAEPAGDSTPPPRGSETVLLVEDESAVRAVARRSLERQGYTVLEAFDGAEAERVWLQNADGIDILVTDVVMPGMGGHALSDRLRARRPSLRVLMVSGYDRDAGRITVDASTSVLQKPFTPETLARRVRQVLDG
ncbi:MAG: ATP-binding protein [Gemmatimonadaceae bacterium]